MKIKKLRSNKKKAALEGIWNQALHAHRQKNYVHAESLYRKILLEVPDFVDALYNLAMLSEIKGNFSEAEALCLRILHYRPEYADAANNLGLLMEKRENFPEAEKYYRQAVKLSPTYLHYYNLASPLYRQRKLDAAEECLRTSLKQNQNYVPAYINLALVLREKLAFDEAETLLLEAIKRDPANADAYFNLVTVLDRQARMPEAIRYLRKSLEINPHHFRAAATLFDVYHQGCDWKGIETLRPLVMQLLANAQQRDEAPILPPFLAVACSDDLRWNLNLAQAHAKFAKRSVQCFGKNFSFLLDHSQKQKLTIGYLSADFREHTFGHIMRYLFSVHRHTEFNIHAYSLGHNDGSECRRHFERDADKFVDLSRDSDGVAAQRIFDDKVDILVDMTGHTAGGRLGITAQRPAPIQVAYLGFPGTSGANFMDYLITDQCVTPPDHQPFYTEKFVYLPCTLQFNHPYEKFSEKNLTRADFGIPEDAFVFCCFNQTYKIDSAMFAIWMEILKRVPNSVLWLRYTNAVAEENLRREALHRGIDASRIHFTKKLPNREEYFKRHTLADVALDTRLYNGGSTTMDALWAGVPVITLLGRHYASRMASSLLYGVNIPELITRDNESYLNLAIHLASDNNFYKVIRKKLWANRMSSPLFNPDAHVKYLEKAYKIMWERFIEGKNLEIISLQE